MKKILLCLSLALAATAACAQYVDDMYDMSPAKVKSPKVTPQRTLSESEAQSAYVDEQRYTDDFEAPLPSSTAVNNELITSYEEALQRRLSAMRVAVEMDDAYWELLQQYQAILESKYDGNLYNIVVVGNEMWVEPKGVTSLFDGSDPTQGVIKYNEEIKKRILGTNTKPAASQQSSQSSQSQQSSQQSLSGDGWASTGSNTTIILNVTVDPWAWNNWGYNNWGYNNWGYNGWGSYYGRYNSWYTPWNDPWYNSWGGHWYNPWYNPWSNPWYGNCNHYWNGPVYYADSRGTYYGNSDYRQPRNGSGGGLGGVRPSRPTGDPQSSTRRLSRSELSQLKPTGANTVSGIGRRVGRNEVQRTENFPTGGVADMRNAGSAIGTIGTFARPVRNDRNDNLTRPTTNFDRPAVQRPSTYDRPVQRPSTYDRPVQRPTTYDRPVQRPSTYDRPVQRPTTNDRPVQRPTTYDRPVQRPTTYDRPTPTQRPATYDRPTPTQQPSTYSRPSSGSRSR